MSNVAVMRYISFSLQKFVDQPKGWLRNDNETQFCILSLKHFSPERIVASKPEEKNYFINISHVEIFAGKRSL